MSVVLESEVAAHYGFIGLHATILNGLEASGVDVARLTHRDLRLIDEFHMGGRPATEYIIGKMQLAPDQHILDVGSGLGGPSRHLASHANCKVTGIDLTPEFVAIARDLTARIGLNDRIVFGVGNALAMPFPDAHFDGAINFHVAMNIRDRAGLYREIARVLKADAVFCVYDVMKGEAEGLHYPLHWAETPETSHVVTPGEMERLLEDAGFVVEDIEDRKEFAINFLHERRDAVDSGDAPLGVHVLLGANARMKIENMLRNLEGGHASPVIMIARRA